MAQKPSSGRRPQNNRPRRQINTNSTNSKSSANRQPTRPRRPMTPAERRRAAMRRKRAMQRRRRRIALVSVFCLLSLILIVNAFRLVIGHFMSNPDQMHHSVSGQSSSSVVSENKKNTKKKTSAHASEETIKSSSSVSLVAVGDNIMHTALLKDASAEDGSYNFTSFYSDIKPFIKAADVAIVNQESPLSKEEPSGYPSFRSPLECGEALIDTGFDVIGQANNHVTDYTSDGVYETIDFWDSYAEQGIVRLGIAKDAEDRAKIRFVERNGIKIGFLAYTYGLNGYTLPDSNPNLVSLIEKDKMAEELEAVKEECDTVVVMMHWGKEYEDVQNEEQEDLAEFLTEHGASLIIGSHPHVCQPAKWIESDNGNRAFCIYSTGNFISAQDQVPTIVEGMLQVTLTRQADGSVVLENPGIMPMVCFYNSRRIRYRVIPMDDYTEDLSAAHALSEREDMSISNLRSIAEKAYGEFLIPKTIPTTYDKDYAAEHNH